VGRGELNPHVLFSRTGEVIAGLDFGQPSKACFAASLTRLVDSEERSAHGVENVKSAAVQSVGYVATTRYSLELPLTCHTARDGD
jgi:hypothetical protein